LSSIDRRNAALGGSVIVVIEMFPVVPALWIVRTLMRFLGRVMVVVVYQVRRAQE
jgi:hypothetical protein